MSVIFFLLVCRGVFLFFVLGLRLLNHLFWNHYSWITVRAVERCKWASVYFPALENNVRSHLFCSTAWCALFFEHLLSALFLFCFHLK